jgi:predicted nucleotidyltransferase
MTNEIGNASLARLFASETLVALLRLFLLRPEERFYQKEIAEMVGARLYLVQRELTRLEQVGLVTRLPHGGRVYYQANRAHPAFEDLKRAFLKTVAVGDSLREALTAMGDHVRVAFIYGSYATGEETAESDLDLFIVGTLWSREVSSVLGALSRELGREVNTAVYPPEEVTRKVREGHHFLREVLAGPKLFLIGDEHELSEIAVGRQDEAASDVREGGRGAARGSGSRPRGRGRPATLGR